MTGTVVLGAAVGYEPAQVAPFLVSLRRTGYAGTVALVVEASRIAGLAREPLLQGVELIPTAPWLAWRYRWLKDRPRLLRLAWPLVHALPWLALRALGALPLPEPRRRDLQRRLAQHLLPPSESRFLTWLDYLRRRPHARVLLADVRDVVFQTEPFAALPAHGLVVGMEAEGCSIGTERWNASRTRLVYGEAVLRELRDQRVSCSGVTAGDLPSMLRYLELMAEQILGLRRAAARQGWLDQALHNYVLCRRWSGPLCRLNTLEGPIATLGQVREADIRCNAGGRVVNRDASVPSIVHQYDRWPALQRQLAQTLAN